jgi:hypothetical protein
MLCHEIPFSLMHYILFAVFRNVIKTVQCWNSINTLLTSQLF